MQFIGAATGTTTVTIPTHQAGDLLIAHAYRDGNTTAPTLPSGWNSISNAGNGNTNSSRLAYRIATGPGTASGTWTNGTGLEIRVYRPETGNRFLPPLTTTQATGATSSIQYPALAFSGQAWIAAFAGHRSVNTTLENAPTGMVQRATRVDTVCEIAGFDTNGPVSSWSLQAVALGGTASGWMSRILAIQEAADITANASITEADDTMVASNVAPPATRPWTPADLAVPPAVWWSAQRSAITQSGGVVSAVENLGSVGGTLNAVGARGPSFAATGWNGLPSFDFSDDALLIDWSHTGNQLSTFLVSEEVGGTSGGTALSLRTPTQAGWENVGNMAIARLYFQDRYMLSRNVNDVYWPVPSQAKSFDAVLWNSAGASVYTNGVAATIIDGSGSPASTSGMAGNFGFSQLYVGDGAASTDAPWPGRVPEGVILTYEPTTLERQQIEGFQAWEWGMQALLPAGHPYREARPTVELPPAPSGVEIISVIDGGLTFDSYVGWDGNYDNFVFPVNVGPAKAGRTIILLAAARHGEGYTSITLDPGGSYETEAVVFLQAGQPDNDRNRGHVVTIDVPAAASGTLNVRYRPIGGYSLFAAYGAVLDNADLSTLTAAVEVVSGNPLNLGTGAPAGQALFLFAANYFTPTLPYSWKSFPDAATTSYAASVSTSNRYFSYGYEDSTSGGNYNTIYMSDQDHWSGDGDKGGVPFLGFRVSPAAGSGPSPVTGTASIQEASDTVASVAAVRVTGNSTNTEAGDTSVSAATLRIVANALITEQGDVVTSEASGVERRSADATINEASDTSASAARLGIAASSTITEANDTSVSAAVVSLRGNATITEQDDITSASSSMLQISGFLLATEQGDTVSATGQQATNVGTLSVIEANDTVTSVSALRLLAQASLTEQSDSSSSAAAVRISGTANLTEAGDTLSASSTYTATATAVIDEASDTAAAVAVTLIHGVALLPEAGDTLVSSASTTLHAAAAVTEQGDQLVSVARLSTVATVTMTEAGDSVSSVGRLAIVGSASFSEQGDVTASAAAVRVLASAGITEADDTLDAVGVLQYIGGGQANIREEDDTLASAGAVLNHGSASILEAGDTLQSSAVIIPIRYANASIAEQGDTVVANSTVRISAALTRLEANDTVSSSALLRIEGGLVAANDDDTLVSTASAPARVSFDVLEEDDHVVSTSLLSTHARVDVVEENDTLSALGSTLGYIGAIVDITEADDVLTSAGSTSASPIETWSSWQGTVVMHGSFVMSVRMNVDWQGKIVLNPTEVIRARAHGVV